MSPVKVFELLSGRAIEDKVSRYSEVYGEILLGMHRDVERLHAIVAEHDRKMQHALAYVARAEAEIGKKSEMLDAAVSQAKHYAESASRLSEAAQSIATKTQGLIDGLRTEMQAIQQSHRASIKQFRKYLIAIAVATGVSLISGAALWITHLKF